MGVTEDAMGASAAEPISKIHTEENRLDKKVSLVQKVLL